MIEKTDSVSVSATRENLLESLANLGKIPQGKPEKHENHDLASILYPGVRVKFYQWKSIGMIVPSLPSPSAVLPQRFEERSACSHAFLSTDRFLPQSFPF